MNSHAARLASATPAVVLVGRRLSHNENLGVGYLLASLRGAGVRAEASWLVEASDVPRIADAIVGARPAVVGLSLPDGGSALLPLALGEMLRRRGYRGRVVAGGPFATLARAWLLERYDWLDAVVRFAGEIPIVEIARRALDGRALEGIAGVTTRETGDGASADVVETTPLRIVPERTELPAILGLPSAHVAASRGCAGRCHYCGPAALQTQEREEGRRSGIPLRLLDERGVGKVRRREIDLLADELAALWHERGVRYFYFVDEHLLPYAEAEALVFLDAWRDALARRRVGTFGFGAMLRADRLTPRLVDGLAETGMVRAFVGLELATGAEGRQFGRSAPGAREMELLDAFARRGIATVSNLMLLHPASTVETVRSGLDLLARIPAGVFEATRMMAYHGTRLAERLAREGRLLGNPLRYGYTLGSSEMERFAETFTRLRAEAFWDYSIAYRTHDAALSTALAHKLGRPVPPAHDARLEGVRRGVNALYLEAYRRALALACAGGGFGEAGALVGEMRERVRVFERELDAAEGGLLRVAAVPGARPYTPMRSAARSAITFVLVASAAACGSAPEPRRDAAVLDAFVAADGAPGDAAADGARDATPDGPSDDAAVECTPERAASAQAEVIDRLASEAACFAGTVALPSGGAPDATSSLTSFGGGSVLVRPCLDTDAGRAAVAALEARAETALAGRVPACAPPSVTADGSAQTDLDRLSSAVGSACGSRFSGGRIAIVLDGSGAVTDVRAGASDAEVAACIRAALTGLTFPCLASFEVCPEFVIAE